MRSVQLHYIFSKIKVLDFDIFSKNKIKIFGKNAIIEDEKEESAAKQ